MVDIRQEFRVDRSHDAVWEFFQDIPEVARCMPGAELTEDRGEGVYAGVVSVNLGPVTASFDGEVTVEPDPASRSCHISGGGVDRRGGGRGHIDVDCTIAPAEGGALLDVDARIKLSGAAARFGRRGLIEEMSRRLVGEFVDCLEAKLAAATPEEAARVRAGEVRGIPLLLSSPWSSVRTFVRRLLRPVRRERSR